MADFVYIDNYSKKGKLGISPEVFNSLVETAIKNVPGVTSSTSKKKGKNVFKLNSPIKTKIHHGIVHVSVLVDTYKSANIQEVTRRIQDEVNNIMLLATEQVPFDVQVKVMNLL